MEILKSLEDYSAFKKEEHEETHQREVPVLVKEPQAGREELKDEEGCDHVLLINLEEVWDGDRHFVWTPDQVGFLACNFLVNTHSTLVKFDCVRDGVWDLRKSLAFQTVAETFLLDFYLVSNGNFAGHEFNLVYNNRHNVPLDHILLSIIHYDFHVRTLLDLVRLQIVVGKEFVTGHRPMIQQQDDPIDENCKNEHPRCHEVFLVGEAPPKQTQQDAGDY